MLWRVSAASPQAEWEQHTLRNPKYSSRCGELKFLSTCLGSETSHHLRLRHLDFTQWWGRSQPTWAEKRMKGSSSKHWVSIKCSTGATAACPHLLSAVFNLVISLQWQKMVKIFISRGNQNFVYCTENGFSCVQWNMPQLNYSCDLKGAAPQAWECMWSEDMTANLWCPFSSLADGNCLTS